jgi:hypothetical protein
MARIIKPGGVFLLITYGQPKTRLHYLCKEKFGWDVEQRTVGTGHPTSPSDYHARFSPHDVLACAVCSQASSSRFG